MSARHRSSELEVDPDQKMFDALIPDAIEIAVNERPLDDWRFDVCDWRKGR
jgi:hypothetical protein